MQRSPWRVPGTAAGADGDGEAPRASSFGGQKDRRTQMVQDQPRADTLPLTGDSMLVVPWTPWEGHLPGLCRPFPQTAPHWPSPSRVPAASTRATGLAQGGRGSCLSSETVHLQRSQPEIPRCPRGSPAKAP